jgi:beta-mannosidase
MDYYKRWKAVHYKAMHAFEPVLVSPVVKNGTADIYVVSDNLEKISAELELTVKDFNGKQIFSKTMPVEVKPNASSVYYSASVKEILAGSDKNSSVAVARLKNGKNVLSSSIFYFVEPKDLSLGKPEIKMSISKKKDVYEIELTSDKLAKDIYLSTDADGFFNDNYFDLLPGESKKIEFRSGEIIDNLKDTIKIMTLADSY